MDIPHLKIIKTVFRVIPLVILPLTITFPTVRALAWGWGGLAQQELSHEGLLHGDRAHAQRRGLLTWRELIRGGEGLSHGNRALAWGREKSRTGRVLARTALTWEQESFTHKEGVSYREVESSHIEKDLAQGWASYRKGGF